MGGDCVQYVLTSQFIVTLARGLSCGCHCSNLQAVERAVSIWPGLVCAGAGSGIVRRGGAFEDMQRHSESDRAGPGQPWAKGQSGLQCHHQQRIQNAVFPSSSPAL